MGRNGNGDRRPLGVSFSVGSVLSGCLEVDTDTDIGVGVDGNSSGGGAEGRLGTGGTASCIAPDDSREAENDIERARCIDTGRICGLSMGWEVVLGASVWEVVFGAIVFVTAGRAGTGGTMPPARDDDERDRRMLGRRALSPGTVVMGGDGTLGAGLGETNDDSESL